jgi:hypothetical protein
MPDKTVKRRLQDCDAALASDDGPVEDGAADQLHLAPCSNCRGVARLQPRHPALHVDHQAPYPPCSLLEHRGVVGVKTALGSFQLAPGTYGISTSFGVSC